VQEGVKLKDIFLPKNSFFVAVLRRANKIIGLEVGERGVCLIRIGSNQSSPFLI
jgi:hypothetical protein